MASTHTRNWRKQERHEILRSRSSILLLLDVAQPDAGRAVALHHDLPARADRDARGRVELPGSESWHRKIEHREREAEVALDLLLAARVEECQRLIRQEVNPEPALRRRRWSTSRWKAISPTSSRRGVSTAVRAAITSPRRRHRRTRRRRTALHCRCSVICTAAPCRAGRLTPAAAASRTGETVQLPKQTVLKPHGSVGFETAAHPDDRDGNRRSGQACLPSRPSRPSETALPAIGRRTTSTSIASGRPTDRS